MIGKVACWAIATCVRAYDVANLDAPQLLAIHADADFGEELATLVAADGAQLAVADSDGRLFVIQLGSSGVVDPLKTYPVRPAQVWAGLGDREAGAGFGPKSHRNKASFDRAKRSRSDPEVCPDFGRADLGEPKSRSAGACGEAP